MEHLKEFAPLLNLVPSIGVIFFVWTKFDKVWDELDGKTSKKYANETFQRSDLCGNTVKNIEATLTEIKADVKTLINRK